MLEETYRIARNQLLAGGLWILWLARKENGDLVFHGWAIPPRDLPMPLRFFVNGLNVLSWSDPPTRPWKTW